MTTWQLIRTMVQKGYGFEMGPHAKGYRGYWACFFKEERVCFFKKEISKVGHAMTPHRAVVMAAKIALNKPVVVPQEEEFKI